MLEARCSHPSVVAWLCQKLIIPRLRKDKALVQVASLLSQLPQHFPLTELAALVKEHNTEVRTKGFPYWTQFVAMLSCHFWPELTS
ncbi:hypothetical protein DFAR_260011 [Desulfarculales bacterium]